ncbi:MAG TPA: 5'/3'-nucleotidase SurE [Vicinamibacterales bacterium]|jgi:5'/3'-nucleotidase|nr:5'/3'-nucleotidase SurE [Vicinamibacterales bacterium]
MNRSFYVRSLVLYFVAACACVHSVPATPAAPAPSSGVTASAPATTSQRPFRILLTNDDGVRAPGILAVAEALQSMGEITIAAPSENQSGKGHSIVTSDPIFVDQVTLTGGLRGFSIIATPATCVKVGVRALMSSRPDLVVSGINRGYNLGMVTYVSGTVGAAREAALMGIPAIASSLSVDETNYAAAAEIVRQVAELVRQRGLDAGVLLNVNVPPGPQTAIKGLRVTRQSAQSGEERFEEQRSPTGRRMFWSIWRDPTGDVEGTDVWATDHGFASITPLRASEFDAKTHEAWERALTRK